MPFSTPAFLSGFFGLSNDRRQQKLPYQNLPFWQMLQGQNVQPFQTQQLGFIPSVQQLGRMSPSETQGLLGIAESEFGVNADDLLYQSQKLRPRGAGAFGYAPRFLGRY